MSRAPAVLLGEQVDQGLLAEAAQVEREVMVGKEELQIVPGAATPAMQTMVM